MGDISAMIQIRIGMRVCYDASVMCDSATPWTVAHQSPPSMGFSRQDYWSGLPCPLLGDLPDSGIEPVAIMSPALAGNFFTTSATWETPCIGIVRYKDGSGEYYLCGG